MLKDKWIELKKQVTKKQVAGAALVSFMIMLISYVICNTSIPLPDEMSVLQSWDNFKSINGLNKDSIPNDVLLVNVTYDKQLVDYKIDGFPVGVYTITDRKKLFDFLRIAKSANNYKYIMLDVIFEKGIESPYDSALFAQIASMERIVIPVHKDAPLQDTILYSKAANADYTVTWKDTNFARFKYLWNDLPSLPLKMYQDIDSKTISKHGFLYCSNNWLCKNGITLQFPIRVYRDTKTEGDKIRYNVVQLGADLLANDTIAPVANDIKDKIVVVGDFYTDVHDTYIGPQPGSIICLNAYYALKRGDHIIFGRYGLRLLFYVLVFIVYFIMALTYLSGFSLSSLVEKPVLKAVISFGSIGLLYWGIAIIGFLFFDTIYNLWFPILAFSVLSFGIYIHSLIKELKNEKTKSGAIPTTDLPDNGSGCQLQNIVSEQSQNKD